MRRRWAVMSLVVASAMVLVPVPSLAAASGHNVKGEGVVQQAGPQPDVYTCYPAWQFAINTTEQSNVFTLQVDGTHVVNDTQSPETVYSTITGTYSTSGTTSGSLAAGWGPIDATVGYSAQQTVTWSSSEETAITVEPGYTGWNEYGNAHNEWYGQYYYLTSSCTETNSEWITVQSPHYSEIISITQPNG